MQTKFFCFTRFSTHGTIDPAACQALLEPLCTYYVFQEEIAPNTARRHLQGYICLKSRSRATTLVKKFAAHYEPRKGSHSEAKSYCQKEESRVPGTSPYEYGSEPGPQGDRSDLESFRDAILSGASDWLLLELFPTQMAKYPRFLHLVRATKLSHDVLRDLPVFEPREGWQLDLSTRLSEPPSPRAVHWRWERHGNVGKSFFALNHQPERTFIITGGKHADIHYAYGYQSIVVFDWARCAQDIFPYGLVEQFKNGYFFSTKYESREKRFVVPHVVVFANFPPDETQMSEDRWDIVLIN